MFSDLIDQGITLTCIKILALSSIPSKGSIPPCDEVDDPLSCPGTGGGALSGMESGVAYPDPLDSENVDVDLKSDSEMSSLSSLSLLMSLLSLSLSSSWDDKLSLSMKTGSSDRLNEDGPDLSWV